MSKATNILIQIDNIRKHREQLAEKIVVLYTQLQKVCDHPYILRGGGEAWECYPDQGRHPFFLRCKVCQLTGKYPSELGTDDRTNWDILNKIKEAQDG